MKIALKDLKKAVAWIEGNTNAEWVHIEDHTSKLNINSVDRAGAVIEIEIYADSNLMPKIRKTDIL